MDKLFQIKIDTYRKGRDTSFNKNKIADLFAYSFETLDKSKQDRFIEIDVLIPVSAWNNGTECTIHIPEITTISAQDVWAASVIDEELWANFGLFPIYEILNDTEQRFTAAATPNVDINLKMRIWK